MVPLAPSAPQNVAAVYATSSSITWTWDPPANHGNKVTHYVGMLFRYNTYWYWYQMSNYETNGTYYQENGLSGNTRYRFRVQAVTGSGNSGSWSSWQYHRTLPAGMPGTLDCTISH